MSERDHAVEHIVSKNIAFACDVHRIGSVWLWSPQRPERLIVVFVEGDEEPNVWQTGVDLLEGDVLVDDLRLTYAGRDALLYMDGHGGEVELRCPAERLLDFHLDIQVAKSSATFERELRGLIDG